MSRQASPRPRQPARRLRSRRGLASALIILILVLLVFFAVLSAVAAAADLRLAQKRASWNQQFYLADAAAVSFFAGLDQWLAGQPEAPSSATDFAGLLESWISLRGDVQTYQIDEQDGDLRLVTRVSAQAAASGNEAGGTRQQAIELTLLIRVQVPQTGLGSRLSVIGWRQWQAPFDYEQGQGGVWGG